MDKLLEKIERDARREEERILLEAQEQAEAVRKKAEEEARREAESIARRYREQAEAERLRVISQTRLESRIRVLSAKEELVEEVFREAVSSFMELPEERYRDWLKNIIKAHAMSGNEEVVAAPYDRDILEGSLLEEINRELSEEGKRGELRLAPTTAPVKRGTILRGEKMETNLSLDTLLERIRLETEEEISRVLFGGDVDKES